MATKIYPETPFDCWCMPCKLCVYYENKHCTHPENPENYSPEND